MFGRPLTKRERRYAVRYVLLTVILFAPLLWAFVAVRNLYPIASWTVMMAGGDLGRGRTYFVLRGETVGGQTIDVKAIELTDALSGRIWTMFLAAVENASLKIRSPHPENVALVARSGGIEKLPRAARLPDLLQAYGELYNSRLPAESSHRLRAVILESYRWDGVNYSNYRTFVESWRQEL